MAKVHQRCRFVMWGAFLVGIAACQEVKTYSGATETPNYESSLFSLSTTQIAVGNTVDATLKVQGPNSTLIERLEATDIDVDFSESSVAKVQSVTKTSAGLFTVSILGLAGSHTLSISPKIKGSALSIKSNLYILNSALSLSLSTLTVSATSVAADSRVTLDVLLNHSSGSSSDLGGLDVRFLAAGGTATGVIDRVTDLGSGAYRTTFKGIKAGTATTITVKVLGYTLTQTVMVAVVPGPATSLQLVVGNAQAAQVSALLPINPKVRVTDSQLNPISGVSVLWTLASGNGTLLPDTNANVRTETIVTDTSGEAAINWTLPATIGSLSLVASSAGLTSVTFTATSTSGSPASLTLVSGMNQTDVVGDTLAPLVVLVRDSGGNAVSGATVDWAVTLGNGTLSATTSISGSDGKAQIVWSLGGTPGLQKVTASITSPALSAQFSAQALVGSVSTIAIISGDTQTGPIRAALPVALVAELRDTYGNPVASTTATWSAQTGNGSASHTTSTSDASGRISETWTVGTTVGSQIINVTSNGRSAFFTATVTASPVNTLAVSAGNSQVVGINTEAPVALVVIAKDSSPAVIAGAVVTWTVTAGNGRVAAETSLTDATGKASMNYVMGPLIGTNTISASSEGKTTTFTLTGDWDSSLKAYLLRGGLNAAISGPSKYLINDFLVRLKAEGLYSKISDMLMMKSSLNKASGTKVYAFKSSTYDGTLVGSPAWTTDGITSTGVGNPPPYIQLPTGASGSMKTAYAARTIIMMVTKAADTTENVYATTANNDFSAGGATSAEGEGFRVGDNLAWGNSDDFANVNQSALVASQPTMIATSFNNGELMSYLNGTGAVVSSVAKATMTDTNPVRLMAEQGGTMTNRGLNGGVGFFADFNTALTTNEINLFYDIYTQTIGQ
ncbi:MAG: Ig-like domain-containing protein [Bdellovibrionota bacterium]